MVSWLSALDTLMESMINYGDGTTVKPDTEIVRKLFADAGNEFNPIFKIIELKAMNQNDKYTLEEKILLQFKYYGKH